MAMDTPTTASGRLAPVRPPRRWPSVPGRLDRLGVVLLTALAAAGYSVYCLGRFYTFHYGAYDLVIFDQAVGSSAHFHPGISIIKGGAQRVRAELLALGDAAVLVPPGDPEMLAAALLRRAGHPGELAELRSRSRRLAGERFAPGQVVTPLLRSLPQPFTRCAGTIPSQAGS
jgi:hypothetical protein